MEAETDRVSNVKEFIQNIKILNQKFLIILTGLPASGKSTFAMHFKNYILNINSSIKINIIDPDKIRTQLFGNDFIPEQESIVRQQLIEQAWDRISSSDIIIIDDINYYQTMRKKFCEIAEFNKIPYFITHISTSPEQCIQWNEKRGKPIPNEVITDIFHKFDIPGKKYHWDRPFIAFDFSTISVENAVLKFLLLVSKFYLKFNNKTPNSEPEHPSKKTESDLNVNKTLNNIEIIVRRVVSILLNLINLIRKEADNDGSIPGNAENAENTENTENAENAKNSEKKLTKIPHYFNEKMLELLKKVSQFHPELQHSINELNSSDKFNYSTIFQIIKAFYNIPHQINKLKIAYIHDIKNNYNHYSFNTNLEIIENFIQFLKLDSVRNR